MKIKVAHVIWDLASTGGAEKLFVHFARNLDRRVFDVSFISLIKEGEIGEKLKGLGFPVYALDIRPAKAWNPMFAVRLFQQFKRLDLDVVHVHLNYAGILAARMARVPALVNHIHNIYPNKSRTKIAIERVLFGLADLSIAVSSNAKEFTLKQLRKPTLAIEVVRNGIDMSVLDVNKTKTAVIEDLGLGQDEQIILTVGSLTEQKGQSHLISAFAELVPAFPKVRLVIVGEGPLRGALERQIEDLKMEEHILLTGLRNDVPDILNSASIFVMPSLWEGIPIALLEAMYFRLPCIVTRVGGVEEIIKDGVDGVLVAAADEPALTRKIESLLKDKPLCDSLGERARGKVRDSFTIGRTMREIERIYLALMEKKKAQRRSQL